MGLAKRSSRKMVVAPASAPNNDTFYPSDWALGAGLPLRDHFDVISVGSAGRGIRTKVGFLRGSAVARFTGQLMGGILQHTLQVSVTSHVYDPYFIGLLTHSCAPNCLLDMAGLELLALMDIAPDSILTIDYALTEDVLYRQFPCGCGAASCRGWITGRRDPVNREGQDYLSHRKASS